MKRDFSRILDECIDRMNSGQSSEECLRLYPEFARELEPLLRAADELCSQSTSVPSQAAKMRGRERVSRAMAELEQERREPRPSLLQRLFGRPMAWAPVAALALALVGYGLWTMFTPTPTPTPMVCAGVLEIRVTDAPTHNVSAIDVTVSDIEVRKDEGEAVWLSVIEEDRSFDLIKLRGVEEVLGSKEVDAGHYTQIRMHVKDVTVTIAGEPKSAVLPSGKLKLPSLFEIEKGKTTVLTLDFDAHNSVVVTGMGKIIFKPVVKLKVTKEQETPDLPTPAQSALSNMVLHLPELRYSAGISPSCQ